MMKYTFAFVCFCHPVRVSAIFSPVWRGGAGFWSARFVNDVSCVLRARGSPHVGITSFRQQFQLPSADSQGFLGGWFFLCRWRGGTWRLAGRQFCHYLSTSECQIVIKSDVLIKCCWGNAAHHQMISPKMMDDAYIFANTDRLLKETPLLGM